MYFINKMFNTIYDLSQINKDEKSDSIILFLNILFEKNDSRFTLKSFCSLYW